MTARPLGRTFPFMNDPAGLDALLAAIKHLHGVDATWVESVPVTETFNGETVWSGVVQVFELIGHPTAKRAFAWSHEGSAPGKRRFVAVLHAATCDSPQRAVQAALVQEGRERTGWRPS